MGYTGYSILLSFVWSAGVKGHASWGGGWCVVARKKIDRGNFFAIRRFVGPWILLSTRDHRPTLASFSRSRVPHVLSTGIMFKPFHHKADHRHTGKR